MEIKKDRLTRNLIAVLLFAVFSASAATDMQKALIADVYLDDFKSDDTQICGPSDVPLNHARARDFFRRARQVDYKIIQDHYDVAPCYVEGILKYRKKPCEWKIRAGATGHIKCEGKTQYFVCDDCEDLFREQ